MGAELTNVRNQIYDFLRSFFTYQPYQRFGFLVRIVRLVVVSVVWGLKFNLQSRTISYEKSSCQNKS